MNDSSTLPELSGLRSWALGAGAAGGLATLAGVLVDPTQFFHSYLLGYVYWLGIGLGCLAILMVYHLTGGGWGVAVRRLLEAGAATLPLMAVLFVPLLFGLKDLYPWTDTAKVAADPVLVRKAGYLNVPFFMVRAAVFFAVWLALAWWLGRWSRLQDETGDPRLGDRMKRLSGLGLPLFGLTMTFAAVDWVMSLDPHWYSTIFGILLIGGEGLGAMALVVAVAFLLSKRQAYGRVLAPWLLNDLGNLLLAFVMLWAYFSFSQLLIIWSANLPEEIPWYLRRISGGWNLVAIALAVFYFWVPFLLLLSRNNKRQLNRLAGIAAGVLVARVLDLFLLIVPEFSPGRLRVHWLDVAALAGVGGVWLTVFVWKLGALPLLPPNDPELAGAIARKH